ncbi:MAG: hypothetical protein ACI9K2_004769 [Myxococcota bacterium]|jgi:hypothetical protein
MSSRAEGAARVHHVSGAGRASGSNVQAPGAVGHSRPRTAARCTEQDILQPDLGVIL